MSLSASLFGSDSAIFRVTNVLGLGIPGWLNKKFGTPEQKPTVQRLGELANQTAKEGEARPIVWGRARPISGNIMHSSTPRIVRRRVKSQSSGGKGGKKKAPKQYEERVFRTYAIRICEGPITAIIRVWRNNKLVYDARGNAWGDQNNGVFLNRARFYLGGWDQMPDPSLESIWGAGEVPAYRGTCYMVVPDEDLTELGGSIPQYIFEVERAEGTYVTSRPYNAEQVDEIDSAGSMAPGILRVGVLDTAGDESLDMVGASMSAGLLRLPLVNYSDYAPESLDMTGANMTAGLLRSPLVNYTDYAPESLDMTGAAMTSGILRVALISYTEPFPESLDMTGASLSGGSLNV